MKKFFLTLFIAVGLFAQEPASSWGEYFQWGTKLGQNSMTISGIQTAINGTDTLYTKALPIQENTEGVYAVWAYWEYTDAASDSIELDMRLGVLFKRDKYPNTAVIKWDAWKSIFNLKSTNTLYKLSMTTSDSSWWIPANLRQYRTYKLDAASVDTCTVYIIDFVR